mmetsp:Transcript_33277/g.37839  ORF Transcript_33277/g.37839 Transcript_33277/m.37839 type:complete len:118 (-) Transcript_33277:315-668(-)
MLHRRNGYYKSISSIIKKTKETTTISSQEWRWRPLWKEKSRERIPLDNIVVVGCFWNDYYYFFTYTAEFYYCTLFIFDNPKDENDSLSVYSESHSQGSFLISFSSKLLICKIIVFYI